MAWTATLKDSIKRDNHWKIIVEFSDGVKTKLESFKFYGSTAKELRAFVRHEALKFDNADTTIDFSQFNGQSIDVTPPVVTPPTPPTQAELDQQTWFRDWYKLQQIQLLLTSVPAIENPARLAIMTDLQTTVATGWKNTYFEDL